MVRLIVALTIGSSIAISALAAPSENGRYARAAFRALDEPPIEQLSRQGDDVIRLLRGGDIYTFGFSIRIDRHGDHGTLTVKRFRYDRGNAAGFDRLGSLDLSARDMTALYRALDETQFWQLPTEEDLAEMARKEPQPPPQVVDGKTYEPNQPLTVICSDASVLGLEVAHTGNIHAVYRLCSDGIYQVARQLIDLAEPLLREH